MKLGHIFWRKLCLLTVDMLAVLATGFLISGLYRYGEGGIPPTVWLWNMLMLGAIYLAGLLISRLYNTLWRYAGSTEFLYCIGVTLACGIIYSIASYVSNSFMPLVFYILISLLITVEILSIRLIYRYLRSIQMSQEKNSVGEEQKRVLLVGAGSSADFLLRDMAD